MYDKFLNEKNDLLNISISGREYKLFQKDILSKISDSKLAKLVEWTRANDFTKSLPDAVYFCRSWSIICVLSLAAVFCSDTNQFFVARSPSLFDSTIIPLLTDEPLHVPLKICLEQLRQEMRFWDIHLRQNYEPCCDSSRRYSCISGVRLPNKKVADRCPWNPDQSDSSSIVKKLCRNFCYDRSFLKSKSNRRCSAFIASISALVILISILNLIVGSLPSMQYCSLPVNGSRVDVVHGFDYSTNTFLNWKNCNGSLVFIFIDIFCVFWFTLEFLGRFYVYGDDKLEFMSNFLNLADLLSSFPYWLELVVWATVAEQKNDNSILVNLLLILRLAKASRILKLGRFFKDLRILGKTVRLAAHELCTLLLFTVFGLLIFAILLYYLERDEMGSAFSSIPAASYWAIVTLTTAGYGDVTPKTTLGKIIAGVACVTGILLMAMPISVLVETFGEIYTSKIWKSPNRRSDSKFGRKNWLKSRRKVSIANENRVIALTTYGKDKNYNNNNDCEIDDQQNNFIEDALIQ